MEEQLQEINVKNKEMWRTGGEKEDWSSDHVHHQEAILKGHVTKNMGRGSIRDSVYNVIGQFESLRNNMSSCYKPVGCIFLQTMVFPHHDLFISTF